MNTRAKRFDRMKSHPGDNWTISDVEAVCGEYGLICLPPRGGGSHYKVSPLPKSEILPIPSHRPIKAVYIRKLIAMIERYGKMGV